MPGGEELWLWLGVLSQVQSQPEGLEHPWGCRVGTRVLLHPGAGVSFASLGESLLCNYRVMITLPLRGQQALPEQRGLQRHPCPLGLKIFQEMGKD